MIDFNKDYSGIHTSYVCLVYFLIFSKWTAKILNLNRHLVRKKYFMQGPRGQKWPPDMDIRTKVCINVYECKNIEIYRFTLRQTLTFILITTINNYYCWCFNSSYIHCHYQCQLWYYCYVIITDAVVVVIIVVIIIIFTIIVIITIINVVVISIIIYIINFMIIVIITLIIIIMIIIIPIINITIILTNTIIIIIIDIIISSTLTNAFIFGLIIVTNLSLSSYSS